MIVAAVLVTLTSVVMGLLGTTLVRSYLFGRVDAQLQGFGSLPVPGRPPGPISHGRQPQLPSLFLIEEISADGHVQLLRGSVHGVPPPSLSAAQLRGPATPFTAAAAGDPGHFWRVVVRPAGDGRHVAIDYSLDALDAAVTRLEIADTAAGVVAIALLAAIGLPLVRVSLAPLARIEDDAEAIAAGDLSRRIGPSAAGTEVGRLAAALNTMLGRIEAAYRARETGEARARDSEDRMRRFVADASHELRTPLTSVRGLAEFSLQQGEAASRGELIRLMTRIQQEAARMGLLVEDLLLLARLDENRPLDRYPVDLSSAAAEAAQVALTIQRAHPLRLVTPADPVIICADSARLRQVIDNLLNNALQHTPAGTKVTVAVESAGGHSQLTVSDEGPGMTAEQAAHVFERFYRTDHARSRASGGTGLGLSIAATLVAAHQGTISVDTRPGQGTAFRVRLPLAAASETAAEEM